MGMELRGYQKEAVDAGLKYLKGRAKKPGVIVVPTGGGKSLCISKIAQGLDGPTLILQPSKEILVQNYEKAVGFGLEPTIYSASLNKKELSTLTYATIGSVKKEVKRLRDEIGLKTILVDECFTGCTEILTEKGFVRFDELEEGIKVAQFNESSESISFVEPIRYIKKEFHGDMVNIKIYRDIWMPVTENHDMIFWNKRLKSYKKRTAKDIRFGEWVNIPSCGESDVCDNGELTPMERLYIATQADGNIHCVTPNDTIVAFSFSKQRKIDRLFELCNMANVEIWEVKRNRKYEGPNVKKKRRFMVRMPLYTTKDIRNHIKYPMSCKKAREVIEECSLWDGSRLNEKMYYYSSTNESQADFYQSVSVIAGYSCYKTVQIDNRKDVFNDVYRLFIDKGKKKYGTQGYKKKQIRYDGFVYCVEVDSGSILVRHNGVPIITGNCHLKYSPSEGSEFMNFISSFEGIKVLGFTATPCRLHSFSSMVDGNYSKLLMLTKGVPHYFENIVHVVQIQELVGMGYWSKIKYEVWEFDESELELNGAGSEYTEQSIKACIKKNGVNNTIYLRLRMLLEERKHILVCMDSVENAYILSDFMNKKYGEITAVVEGGTPKKERESIIERFKKGELKIVFNYATLSVGFDFPELDCVIFGRPTFSYAVYYQVVGRGVRVSPEKEDVLFIDCCNNYSRFGRVEDLTIEDYPDVGWGMFTGDKLISGVIMGAEITKQDIQRRIEERVRKKRDAEEGNFIMKFGKYKGWVVNKIPLGYLQWVIKNVPFSEDWDKYLAYVKKHELNAIKK